MRRLDAFFAVPIRLGCLAVFLLICSVAFSKPAPSKELRFELGASSLQDGKLILRGAAAKYQLLVSGVAESGALRDVTREVRYQVSPASVAKVDTNGVLTPAGDGKATLTAKAQGVSVSMPIVVENFKSDPPINFPNQV